MYMYIYIYIYIYISSIVMTFFRNLYSFLIKKSRRKHGLPDELISLGLKGNSQR